MPYLPYILLPISAIGSIALAFLSYYVSIDAMPKSNKKRKHTTWFIVLAIIVAVVNVVIGINAYFVQKIQDKEKWQNQWSGQLKSRVRSEAKHPIINLGGCGALLTFVDLPCNEPVMALQGDNRNAIYLCMVDGEARISVEIRDGNGALIGFIRDNFWQVFPGMGDRNFNKDTLEILDNKGDPIFQIHIDGERIDLAGVFFSYNTPGDQFELGPWLHETQGRIGRTLFKYPSSEHPGELNPIEPITK